MVFAQNTDLRRIGVVKRSSGAVQLLGAQSGMVDTPDLAEVKYPHERLNSFSVEVYSREPGLLIVSETWDPGWSAKVNGHRAPVPLVDGALLGVYVQPGKSHIEFSYLPVHFLLGMFLALGASASALFCIAGINKQRKGSN
jgi:uncharacterized membrane protein YfhO